MSIGIGDFASRLVREGQYGQLATLGQPGDQPTLDLVASINGRLAAVWGRADWKWTRELLKFALTPAVRQYVVAAVSGNGIDRIQDLIPYESTGTYLQGEPLDEHTTRQFYSRVAQPPWNGNSTPGPQAYNQGYPTDYYIVGQDVNGAWNVIVDPVPNLAGFMGGYAKGLRKVYTAADVLANTQIAYFPNDVVDDALFVGCMIDVAWLRQTMTPESALTAEAAFERKIARLVADQIGVATDNTPITTPMPATVARLRRARGRGWSR